MTSQSRTPVEARCAEAITELDQSPYTSLSVHGFAPADPSHRDREFAFSDIREKSGVNLDDATRAYFFPNDEIHVAWRSTTGPLIVGEFCLMNIHRSLTGTIIPPEDWTLESEEEDILGDLYIIDSTPHGGTGNVAGLYVTPQGGLEVWYYDMGLHRLEQLDLDYRGYVDAALVTKGTSGWQYLFADIHFSSDELHTTAADLNVMLETFPEVFPSHEYQPLHVRFEERL